MVRAAAGWAVAVAGAARVTVTRAVRAEAARARAVKGERDLALEPVLSPGLFTVDLQGVWGVP
ncbi:hypothetical protein GCM10010211_16370 [Streptomyces albospinus]|uniref:Uncharacterized protein n=1 Tax=Streptomyces albospinus TaxID=285515 RepID=A0ABQ2UT87_9ACTN|nr:hypothetical protein GCM10010211_16370 [Streptomyces albospinus]